MKFGKEIISFILAMLITFAASAQTLPKWKVGEICHNEGDRAACAEFEARAYRLVAGPWPTFPSEITTACLEELDREQVKSYRILRDCLEAEVFKAHRSAQQKRSVE